MRQFFGKNLYYITQYINREPVIAAIKELDHTQWNQSVELESIQWKRLINLVNHVYYHVPFYKELFRKYGIEPGDIKSFHDFKKIPMLSKEQVREFGPALMSNSKHPEGYIVARTSGSTGKPLAVCRSKISWSYHHANILRLLKWHGIDIGAPQARIGGSSTSRWKRLQEKTKDVLFNRIKLSALDMEGGMCAGFFEKILKFKPFYLYGYPSAIHHFSRMLKDYGYEGKSADFKVVIVHGEELEDLQKKEIEEFFGCRVINSYGAAEVGLIAYECPEGGMHIPSESIIVETIEDENGVKGCKEFVVTDLHNYVMPLIRYGVGDMGDLVDRVCSCGRGLPLMTKPKGKIRTVLTTPEGKIIHTVFFNSLFKDLYAMGGMVKEYQIIQISPADFVLKMVVDRELNIKHRDFITFQLRKYFGEPVNFRLDFVDHIERPPHGKFLTFIREYSLNGAGYQKED